MLLVSMSTISQISYLSSPAGPVYLSSVTPSIPLPPPPLIQDKDQSSFTTSGQVRLHMTTPDTASLECGLQLRVQLEVTQDIEGNYDWTVFIGVYYAIIPVPCYRLVKASIVFVF